MNDKAKTVSTNVATGYVLYRVNYNWVADTGQLRGGTIVIDARDIAEAQKLAPERLRAFLGARAFRITSCVEY